MPTARFFKVVLPVKLVYQQVGFAGPASADAEALGRWKYDLTKTPNESPTFCFAVLAFATADFSWSMYYHEGMKVKHHGIC